MLETYLLNDEYALGIHNSEDNEAIHCLLPQLMGVQVHRDN